MGGQALKKYPINRKNDNLTKVTDHTVHILNAQHMSNCVCVLVSTCSVIHCLKSFYCLDIK